MKLKETWIVVLFIGGIFYSKPDFLYAKKGGEEKKSHQWKAWSRYNPKGWRRLHPAEKQICLAFSTGLALEQKSGYIGGERVGLKLKRVPGTKYFVNEGMYSVLASFLRSAKKEGLSISINSAYRTIPEQCRLRMDYLSGRRKKVVARVGYSMHGTGRAVDFSMKNRKLTGWIRNNAKRHCLQRTVSGEPWHYEAIPGCTTLPFVNSKPIYAHRSSVHRSRARMRQG